MTPIKKKKVYRKNEWRKVLSFWGDKVLYQWRPAGGKYVEIKSKYLFTT